MFEMKKSAQHPLTQFCHVTLLTALGATYPPGAMPIPVESSNRSFRPLLTTAGVGEGAKVAGTEEGMKDCPTYRRKGRGTSGRID